MKTSSLIVYTALLAFLTGCSTPPEGGGGTGGDDPATSTPIGRTKGGDDAGKGTDGDAGKKSPVVIEDAAPGQVEFRMVVGEATVGAKEYYNANNQEMMFVDSVTLLDNADVASAAAGAGTDGPTLQLILTPEGKQKLARITRNNTGKKMAILVSNQLIVAPTIQEEISGGQVTISGSFTDAGAQRIAASINKR